MNDKDKVFEDRVSRPWDLPPGQRNWFDAGWDARQPEIDALQADRDKFKQIADDVNMSLVEVCKQIERLERENEEWRQSFELYDRAIRAGKP